jgi:hypothetical protein
MNRSPNPPNEKNRNKFSEIHSHASSSSPQKSSLYYEELSKCLDGLDFRPYPDGLYYLDVELQKVRLGSR